MATHCSVCTHKVVYIILKDARLEHQVVDYSDPHFIPHFTPVINIKKESTVKRVISMNCFNLLKTTL